MSANTRLRVSAAMILLSVVYGVLVAKDPDAATAIAVGFIALILTATVLSHVWKKE